MKPLIEIQPENLILGRRGYKERGFGG